MERRKALVIAGTAVAVASAGAAAIGANFGLLGFAGADDDIGKLKAATTVASVAAEPGGSTTSTTLDDIEVRVEDVFVDDGAGGTVAPSTTPTSIPSPAASTATTIDDREDDDDAHDVEDVEDIEDDGDRSGPDDSDEFDDSGHGDDHDDGTDDDD